MQGIESYIDPSYLEMQTSCTPDVLEDLRKGLYVIHGWA